jgi:TPR repeat protein
VRGAPAADGAVGDGASPEDRPAASPADLAAMLVEGDAMMALGDIASARLYYDLAMRRGSAVAARKLARSYDPLFLQGERVSGLRPDVVKAIAAYRAAAELGDTEAAAQLATLLQIERDLGGK